MKTTPKPLSPEQKARTERFLRTVAREAAERGLPIYASTNPYIVPSPRSASAPPNASRARPAGLPVYASTDPTVATVPLPRSAPTTRLRPSKRRDARGRLGLTEAKRLQRAVRAREAQQDLEKAKRARLRHAEAYVHGSDPTPLGRYSQDEADVFGERGLALMMPNGKYAYVIQGRADLSNAIAAYRNPDYDNTGVRAWIVERAVKLRLVEALPKGWAEPKQKLHPKELGPTGPVGAVNIEAPASGGAGASEGGGTAI